MQLQQWTNFCTNFSPKSGGVGDTSPCRKKWGRRPPASPPHYIPDLATRRDNAAFCQTTLDTRCAVICLQGCRRRALSVSRRRGHSRVAASDRSASRRHSSSPPPTSPSPNSSTTLREFRTSEKSPAASSAVLSPPSISPLSCRCCCCTRRRRRRVATETSRCSPARLSGVCATVVTQSSNY